MSTSCPDDNALSLHVEGRLAGSKADAVLQHLEGCRRCRELVVLLRDEGPAADADAAAPGSAQRLGRYVVLRQLGGGAMGTVLAAYDEQLNRRVAIKVLRERLRAAARAMCEREARALARLTHPNVVQVYEVGDDRGQLYIVMEYVEGETLAQWQRGRAWREVVAAYCDAGEGLAAAHAAGLIHRDFKPRNVMVTAPGGTRRVKVLDFGLARHAEGEAVWTTAQPVGTTASDEDVRLTSDGAFVGTPAYMAPEQFLRADVEATADQFSFCAALWEGVFGERPFPDRRQTGVDESSLRRAKRAPPSGHGAPGWLIRTLDRGLSTDPANRWPSMTELLAALRRHRGGERRSWGYGAIAIALLGMGATVASSGPEPCQGASQRLGGAWNDARREQVRAAFADVERSFSAPTLARIEPALDRYARQWQDTHHRACRATRIDGDQSETAMDLRMACLMRARTELDAVTSLLAHADVDVAGRADELVARLPSVIDCADAPTLQSDAQPVPPGEVEAVGIAREHLARAGAARLAGRFDEAEARVSSAARALVGVEHGPVRTELDLATAQVAAAQFRLDDAVESAERAVRAASYHRQWPQLATASVLLIELLGSSQERFDAALRLRPIAEGAAGSDARRRAAVSLAIGKVLAKRGDLDDALTLVEDALGRRRELLGDADPAVADALLRRGSILQALGRTDEALAAAKEATQMREEALSPGHPDVAEARAAIATALSAAGEYEAAQRELEQALAIGRAALGADHPRVAKLEARLGSVLNERGAFDDAQTHLRGAFEVQTRALGPDHLDVIDTRVTLSVLAWARGDSATALEEMRAILESLQRVLGPEHRRVGKAHCNVAVVLNTRGELAEAQQSYRRCLSILERALGPEHPDVATAHANLGAALSEAGHDAEAEEHHRQALALRTASLGPEHPLVATSHYGLAHVLESRKDHRAAEEEYRRALEIWEAALGLEHPRTATAVHNMGVILHKQGRTDEAEVELRRALELRTASLRADHPDITVTMRRLAELMHATERDDDALPLAQEAWTRVDQHQTKTTDRAGVAFLLARILAAARPGERARARSLAEQALELYRDTDADTTESVERVTRWLEREGG